MSIDKVKEILSKRTNPMHFRRAGTCGSFSTYQLNVQFTDRGGVSENDARSIVLLNNCADELFAVYDAAKNVTKYIPDSKLSSYEDDWMHWLKNAIQALEVKLAKELG